MMRLVFMGTPEWAIPSLEGLMESGHELIGVLSSSNRTPDEVIALPTSRNQHTCSCCSRMHSMMVSPRHSKRTHDYYE